MKWQKLKREMQVHFSKWVVFYVNFKRFDLRLAHWDNTQPMGCEVQLAGDTMPVVKPNRKVATINTNNSKIARGNRVLVCSSILVYLQDFELLRV